MSGLNKVQIIGNLGRDPESRHTQDGRLIVNLSVAAAETWKDKSTGERREKTEWIRVVIFNEGLAKVAAQYLHKGSKVYLEGKLRTRKWTDNAGVEKYTTEVVLENFSGQLIMLDGRRDNGGAHGPPEDYGDQSQAPQSKPQGGPVKPSLDDEIPFAPEWRG